VPALTRTRVVVVILTACLALPLLSFAADGGGIVVEHAVTPPAYILVGFVGGFVRHDNPNQGPVLFAQRTQATLPKNSYVHVFENRHRRTAYKTILGLLDGDHNGILSEQEKTQAHIILFGHSWGGSAVVLLARELERVGIPVLLTVQVDSVAKPWQHDDIIPGNVAAAANFYQPYGFIHGRSTIHAADDSKTRIIGNYRFDYHQAPVKCENPSWFDRTFTPDHMQSDCDPRIWNQIGSLVLERVGQETQPIAALPRPLSFLSPPQQKLEK
jgi:pimeloyl-ACP methyl ester carboxylesterase